MAAANRFKLLEMIKMNGGISYIKIFNQVVDEFFMTLYPGINATASVTVGQGAAAGTIVSVSVVNRGANYSQTPLVTIAPPPNGGVQATATANVFGGRIRSIDIRNPGSGYDSMIPNITITNPGSGYTSPPTVTLTDPEGDITVQTVTGPNRTFTVNDAKTFNVNSTIQVKNLVLEALNESKAIKLAEI